MDRFDSVLVLTLGFKKSAAFLLALQSLSHNHEKNRFLSIPLGPQEGWERYIIKQQPNIAQVIDAKLTMYNI